MKHFKTIIIGGGASGMMCALSSQNKNIAVIDQGHKLAKKILVTGNGKCNLTNMQCLNDTGFEYNQDISIFLKRFSVLDTLHYFSGLGLETIEDTEGRIYPLSLSAKSVMDTLQLAFTQKNISSILNETVQELSKQGETFIIQTDKNTYSCEKVVLATGGDTFSFILDKFHIAYKEFNPSLCALKASGTKQLSGQKLNNVFVTATDSHNHTHSEVGEVLFKDEGLSGIVIFNCSALFARSGNYQGQISIDLLKDYSLDQVIEKLNARKNNTKNTHDFLTGLFTNTLNAELLYRAKIKDTKNSMDLGEDEITRLAQMIKNLTFTIDGYYENNQVYSGGVNLNELTPNLESKKVKGLYFCGEICDVDGICGGYNLQWAWTSGHIVGESL